MIKKLMFALILIILIIAIYGTFGLAMNEWRIGDVCPKIIGIPACYIVLCCFAIGLITHLIPMRGSRVIFFIFIGIVTLIATTGALGEITGLAECPRTSGGIPMCFISLGICISLLTAKISYLKLDQSH
jgi:hypothetical protein